MKATCCIKVFVFSFGVLISLTTSFAYGRSLAEILASKKLIVGMSTHDYPPFYHTDKDQIFTGFDVELARELGKSLGVSIVFQREATGYSKFPYLLINNQADILLAAYRVNLDRAKIIKFSQPYQTERHVFVVLRKNEGVFKRNIATIRKPATNPKVLNIGLLRKTTYQPFLEKNYPSSNLLFFDQVDK